MKKRLIHFQNSVSFGNGFLKLAAMSGFILSACIFFSCATTNFFSPAAPCHVPEDFFGISPDRSPLNKEDFELLDNLGASWIRTTIRWTGVEREEGKWDFEFWDNFVAKGEAAGKNMILILGFDNTWLYSDNKEHRDLTEREIPYFLKYVEQVVSRYGTRIVYEVWNEPNFLFWKGSSKHFYALSAATVEKIREIEPNAVILVGSTARVSKRFTRGMYKAGALENTDGFSLHPYATSPRGTVDQINKQQSVFNEVGFDKPIWVTEVGYSTGPISFCPIRRYPEYIIKTLSCLAARANEVRTLIWFELMNDFNKGEEPNRLHPKYHFGLVYPNKIFKPGAEAFKLTAENLAGSEYRPELPIREGISNNTISLYFRKPNGANTLILWKDSGKKIKLRLSVSGTAELFYHDITSGEASPLPADTELEIGRNPVFITWTGTGTPRLSKPLNSKN